jgi:ABC-type glycerol-3-phosphate transport system permease component
MVQARKFKGENHNLSFILMVSLFPSGYRQSLISSLKTRSSTPTWLWSCHSPLGCPWPWLTAFFRQQPHELEEAARMDGAGPLRTFWEVTPASAPGIFTTAILTFIYCWNEFLFALAFTTNDASRTIPVAIVMFSGYHTVPWGQILAAVTVVTVPVTVLVLILQRRIISGLTSGAIKG